MQLVRRLDAAAVGSMIGPVLSGLGHGSQAGNGLRPHFPLRGESPNVTTAYGAKRLMPRQAPAFWTPTKPGPGDVL